MYSMCLCALSRTSCEIHWTCWYWQFLIYHMSILVNMIIIYLFNVSILSFSGKNCTKQVRRHEVDRVFSGWWWWFTEVERVFRCDCPLDDWFGWLEMTCKSGGGCLYIYILFFFLNCIYCTYIQCGKQHIQFCKGTFESMMVCFPFSKVGISTRSLKDVYMKYIYILGYLVYIYNISPQAPVISRVVFAFNSETEDPSYKVASSWCHEALQICCLSVYSKHRHWKSKTKQRMVFGMIHVKDSLLPMGKVWSLDFLGRYIHIFHTSLAPFVALQ